MSENKGNINSSSSLTRKIGVGLTRTNLSPGARDASQRSPRDRPLLTPSRLKISGSSLGTSRTNSESYSTGYNRLGGLKNISAPNVSSNILGKSSAYTPVKKPDFDKIQEPTLRKNLSATNTEELLKNDQGLSGVNVQRSQSANRGVSSTGWFSQTDQTLGLAVYQTPKQDGLINDVSESTTRKRENYDLDLEQDEEDATVEVKDNVDGSEKICVETTSPSSPSKDSGYNSPRTDPIMETFNSSGLESRSPSKSDTVGKETPSVSPEFRYNLDNSPYKPERPVRSKHSAKKKSIDQPVLSPRNIDQSEHLSQNIDKSISLSQTLSQSPWQQGSINTQFDTLSADITGNYEINARGDILTKNKPKDSVLEDVDHSSKSVPNELTKTPGVKDLENVPVAKPRVHRRLTKRSISFRHLEEDEYIGFASLPEQVHRKAVRRGFEFTLMVVGETGLGKSTLINSLFLMDLYKDRKVENIEERIQKTVELEKKELEIEERGVKLKLTIVDTPGFNDAVNAEESWKPIGNYIDKQFETYFTAESGLNRKNIQDTRVHCCLYFISPYGHGLRPVDIMVMKKLHHKVNIIPLIAKSDMLTKPEVKRLKEQVLKEIEKHSIDIYQYPECDSDEDEEFKLQDKQLKNSIPFAVVSSNTVVEAGGKKIRGRMYPWGIVEVENPLHSDFIKLRQMLISTHMQDLKDVTCDVHYENYRAEHLSEQMTNTQRERGKLKRDSAANLEASLATEKLLQEKEAEIKRMQEMLAKMQAQLQTTSPRANGRVGHV